MRRVVTGEQVAQIYNPDPFARPVFRAPVYQTPAGIILLAWLARFVFRLLRLVFRHPVAASVLAVLAFLWFTIGWIGLSAMTACIVLVLVIWRCYWPSGFTRWAAAPARSAWRAWGYRRRWHAVMTIADLAPFYLGRIILPVLVKVTSTRYVDRVAVRLVSGQSAGDFAKKADNLAHGFRAMLCRVRTAKSGAVVLEFVRRDALAAIIPALPIPEQVDLKALPVGRREDGLPWLVKLHGTHVLIAGATGAGKASLLWGLVRAMFPAMRTGLVRVLAAAQYRGLDGKLRSHAVTFTRKTDADRALALIEAEITHGTWTDPDRAKIRLADYADVWIAQRPGLRPRTVEIYRGLLRRHVSPYLGNVPLGKIDTPMIRDWRARLLHQGISVSETAKAYRFLRAMLMTAADDRIILRNPCRVRGAGEEKPEERPTLTVRQVYELADRMPDDRHRVLVLVAAFASLRWGEITALRRCDIDIEAGTGDRHPAARPAGYRRRGRERSQIQG